ncbi:MAG: zinc-dependent metalloprotease [Fimbriimonadales bacterium]
MTLTALAAMLVVHSAADAPFAPPAVRTQEPTAAAQNPDDPYVRATKDYTATDGVFKLWRLKENYMFEVPKAMIGRDFLWVTELKKTPAGMYNGTAVASEVVRWEERDDRMLLRLIRYNVRSNSGDPIDMAVEQSNVAPIIRVFDIKGRSPSGSPLFEVGNFFKNDIPEFSVRGSVAGTGQDSTRSFIEKISMFPNNVNVDVLMTFMPGQASPFGSIFGGPTGSGPRTAVVSHSISLLPEKPMMGRVADSRVGYFSTGYQDYGTDYHGVKEYAFINRYRLEKKDPAADVSEPVKPIIYYISREVPNKWRPYIKQAVEDWQKAFEAAGFKNAILCKDAPSEKEDPNWSPEDGRYSVIRWAPLPIENAMGPSTVDPRSGEIMNAHIILWHDVLKLETDWYFSQASPNDARARRLPFSDELQGKLLRFVVAHELGHTLGLPHNGKGSASVPIKSLRDPKWCAANGTATSIMDYARFNYVAQPGDGVTGDALIPKIGKYDLFAIKWGYTPVPGARTPWDERATLDRWASAQVTDPQLRFYDNFSSFDPTAQAEALGDNAVEASTLGLKNLKRVVSNLKPATVRLGEDYTELARMHGAVVSQYSMYLSHVAAVVGGIEQIDWRGGRGGAVFNPVGAGYQRSAVQYILDNAFNPPLWLFPKEITDKLTPDMGLGRLRSIQSMGVSVLLSDSRLNRMLQNEAVDPKAFTVDQMMAMARQAVWSDLSQPAPTIGFHRRNLQRAWVNSLTRKMASSTDIRAIAMAELETELGAVTIALPKVKDATTRAHLKELRKQIAFCLNNPDKATGAPAAQAPAFPFAAPVSADDELAAHLCPLCQRNLIKP